MDSFPGAVGRYDGTRDLGRRNKLLMVRVELGPPTSSAVQGAAADDSPSSRPGARARAVRLDPPHGFDQTSWTTGSPADRLNLLPAALEQVLAQEDGKVRCLKTVRELSQARAPSPRCWSRRSAATRIARSRRHR